MTDIAPPPEAVEAAIIAHHNFVLGEDVPLTKRDIGIVFQSWHAALTAALPHIATTTLPSVEDVARAILMVTQVADADPDYAWSVQYPEVQDELLDQARAVLALLPGRTEAEVKVEALREAASAAVTAEEGIPWDDDHDRATVSAWLDDRAARIARGEGS